MERHFQKELEALKTLLIKMGSMAEENFRRAVEATQTHNYDAASAIIVADKRVDALEIEIDNAILDLLALQQPVARDLRLIIAAQKINNDLERISDHAVNIAQAVLNLQQYENIPLFSELEEMETLTRRMLKDALDSFILLDTSLARTVLTADDSIDLLNKNVSRHIIHLVKENPLFIEPALEFSRISRNIERVGDLSTNIAEEVIFLTQARIVKHHADEMPDADKEQ